MIHAPAPAEAAWLTDIYAGTVTGFCALQSMHALSDWAAQFCAERFAPFDPQHIHRHHAPGTLADLINKAGHAFQRDPTAGRLMRSVFEEAGLRLADTAADRLILRIQPPVSVMGDGPAHARSAPLAFHRDTWGSNLYAQVNWWAPIFPVTRERTIALFPCYWDRPIRNTSAAFNLPHIIARRKADPGSLTPSDAVPHALDMVEEDEARPVVIDPGTIIAFSGQHAHASIRNLTSLTRFSLDTRTLSIRDTKQGRGAPNIDGDAPFMALKLFRRLSDDTALAQLIGAEDFVPYHRFQKSSPGHP